MNRQRLSQLLHSNSVRPAMNMNMLQCLQQCFDISEQYHFLASLDSASELTRLLRNCQVKVHERTYEGRKLEHRCSHCDYALITVKCRGPTTHVFEKGEHRGHPAKLAKIIPVSAGEEAKGRSSNGEKISAERKSQQKEHSTTPARISGKNPTALSAKLVQTGEHVRWVDGDADEASEGESRSSSSQKENFSPQQPRSSIDPYTYIRSFDSLHELEIYRAAATLSPALVTSAGERRTYQCPVSVVSASNGFKSAADNRNLRRSTCPYSLIAFRSERNRFTVYSRGAHNHASVSFSSPVEVNCSGVELLEEQQFGGSAAKRDKLVEPEGTDSPAPNNLHHRPRLSITSKHQYVATLHSELALQQLCREKGVTRVSRVPTHGGTRWNFCCSSPLFRKLRKCRCKVIATVRVDSRGVQRYEVFQLAEHNHPPHRKLNFSKEQQQQRAVQKLSGAEVTEAKKKEEKKKKTLAECLIMGAKARATQAGSASAQQLTTIHLQQRASSSTEVAIAGSARALKQPLNLLAELIHRYGLSTKVGHRLAAVLHSHGEWECWRKEHRLHLCFRNHQPELQTYRCYKCRTRKGHCPYRVLTIEQASRKDSKAEQHSTTTTTIYVLEHGEHSGAANARDHSAVAERSTQGIAQIAVKLEAMEHEPNANGWNCSSIGAVRCKSEINESLSLSLEPTPPTSLSFITTTSSVKKRQKPLPSDAHTPGLLAAMQYQTLIEDSGTPPRHYMDTEESYRPILGVLVRSIAELEAFARRRGLMTNGRRRSAKGFRRYFKCAGLQSTSGEGLRQCPYRALAIGDTTMSKWRLYERFSHHSDCGHAVVAQTQAASKPPSSQKTPLKIIKDGASTHLLAVRKSIADLEKVRLKYGLVVSGQSTSSRRYYVCPNSRKTSIAKSWRCQYTAVAIGDEQGGWKLYGRHKHHPICPKGVILGSMGQRESGVMEGGGKKKRDPAKLSAIVPTTAENERGVREEGSKKAGKEEKRLNKCRVEVEKLRSKVSKSSIAKPSRFGFSLAVRKTMLGQLAQQLRLSFIKKCHRPPLWVYRRKEAGSKKAIQLSEYYHNVEIACLDADAGSKPLSVHIHPKTEHFREFLQVLTAKLMGFLYA